MNEQLLARLTKQNRSREMYSSMRRNTRKQYHTSAFHKKWSYSGVRRETDNKKKKEAKKSTDKKELMHKNAKNEYVFIPSSCVVCLSFYT